MHAVLQSFQKAQDVCNYLLRTALISTGTIIGNLSIQRTTLGHQIPIARISILPHKQWPLLPVMRARRALNPGVIGDIDEYHGLLV